MYDCALVALYIVINATSLVLDLLSYKYNK